MRKKKMIKKNREYSIMSWYDDCVQFTRLMEEKTGKKMEKKIDRAFIMKMVQDEMKELEEAKDMTEEVDALLDTVYYILQHLSRTGLDMNPIWKFIHKANMTKFEKGYMREDGKWMKPDDFQPPDEDIRKEIHKQEKKTMQKKSSY